MTGILRSGIGGIFRSRSRPILTQIRQLSSPDDRVEEGAVTPAKDQGNVGHYWACAAVGTLEGLHFVVTRNLVEPSLPSNVVHKESEMALLTSQVPNDTTQKAVKSTNQVGSLFVEDDITATEDKHLTYMSPTAERYNAKRFQKAQYPVVERLTNSVLFHGRSNGKKLRAGLITKRAMKIIQLLTDRNPVLVIVDAVINSTAREDATQIGAAGVVRCHAVDILPLRRVSQAIHHLTTGAFVSALRNNETIAECLADELINAAKGSSNSYAIKKKDEIERVAKGNR